jgi:hypothetical protein
MSEPIETLVVTFFEHPCLTARLADDTIVLSTYVLGPGGVLFPLV